MNNKINKKRSNYTLEFKQDAAGLVIKQGYTHQQAADNLDVSLSAIGRWVRAERGTFTTSSEKKSILNLRDQSEIIQLHKENKRLRMEPEI